MAKTVDPEKTRLLESTQANYDGDEEITVLRTPETEPSSRRTKWSILPAGSVRASIFNLVGNTLGAGCLSLPYAFYRCGIVTSVLLLILGMVASVYSLRLLVRARHRSGLKSFEELAKQCYGHYTEVFVEVNIILFCFGVCVAYIVAVGDILMPVMTLVLGPESLWCRREVILPVLVVGVVLPLSLVSRVNTLRFTTALSVSSICFLVLIIVAGGVGSFWARPNFDNLKVWDQRGCFLVFGDIFFAAPIILFAYGCQALVFVIYDELEEPSEKTMFAVVDRSMVLVMVIYLLVGMGGYVTYQQLTKDDILKNLDLQNPIVALAQGMFGVAVVLAYPLNVFPARHSIDNMLCPGAPFSYLRYVAVTVLMVMASLGLALLIPSISSVFSLMGATTSVVVCFVAPAIYFLHLFPSESDVVLPVGSLFTESKLQRGVSTFWDRLAAWSLLVGGVAVGVVSTVISLQQFLQTPK